MPNISTITPFLWFNDQAEEAATFYIGIFKNSRIVKRVQPGCQSNGKPLTVVFELDGQKFVALNGGPMFKFNEAVSFVVHCTTQDEVDYYWEKLGEGADASAQKCGWLKDRYGLSWQIVPQIFIDLISDSDPTRSGKAMAAMMEMKKIDIAALKQAVSA